MSPTEAWMGVALFLIKHRWIVGGSVAAMLPIFWLIRKETGATCQSCQHRVETTCKKVNAACEDLGHFCGALLPISGMKVGGGR